MIIVGKWSEERSWVVFQEDRGARSGDAKKMSYIGCMVGGGDELFKCGFVCAV